MPRAPTPAATPAPAPAPVEAPRPPDPDLHRPPPVRLLDIDWAQVSLTDDAAALALWEQIAPTGADWFDKLQEIPAAATRPLAVAILRGGNFACTPPPSGACPRPAHEVPAPADTAGLADPCLRRLLALWALPKLEDADLPAVHPALLAIAQIPPPESQLVEAAIDAIPPDDQDARLAILAAAARAGHHDLVDAAVASLDDAHLAAAAARHHIAGAFHALAAPTHRAIFLAAVLDDALPARTRTAAINELVEADGKLAPDLAATLAAAVKTRDCAVAAAAARTLAQRGDPRFVPRRPRTRDVGRLMRALCVLASYELLQPSDEPSLLASYLAPRGLERVTVTYDPLSEIDSDGDGDPRTTHTGELLARDEAVLPELEDLVRAMRHCTGPICVSDDHEFRFVWTRAGADLLLSRIELAERPACTPKP